MFRKDEKIQMAVSESAEAPQRTLEGLRGSNFLHDGDHERYRASRSSCKVVSAAVQVHWY
tara:strand:- start:874 stop:1053 length:180 start_codon:yes stop_codon:yes gene_type:complete